MSALTPAQKRAISILRNSGVTVNLVAANVAVTAPERVYATKAERAAGDGFTCTCGRTDLRYAPKPGKSFHNAPDGTLHDLR